MVTSNGLISCVIGLDERFRPSMTSTNIGVFSSTRANLYCHTSFLSIKHVNAPKSKNVWASIITSLLHFIMIGTQKHGVSPEDRLEPFSLHDASRLSFTVPIENAWTTCHTCHLCCQSTTKGIKKRACPFSKRTPPLVPCPTHLPNLKTL